MQDKRVDRITLKSFSHLLQDSQKTAPKDIKGMWNAYSYYVGGHLFTLDEIEHGILRLENARFVSEIFASLCVCTSRANAGHPSTPKSPVFPMGDKRRNLVMSVLDHRKVPRSAIEIGAKISVVKFASNTTGSTLR